MGRKGAQGIAPHSLLLLIPGRLCEGFHQQLPAAAVLRVDLQWCTKESSRTTLSGKEYKSSCYC